MRGIGFILLLLVGCSSADSGPRMTQGSMSQSDTPFGGGFPADHRPSADPFNRMADRGQIKVDWRGDNGAPETRVGGTGDSRIDGGNPDSRIYRP